MISKEREAETARNMEIWRQQVQNEPTASFRGSDHFFWCLTAYYVRAEEMRNHHNTAICDVKGGSYCRAYVTPTLNIPRETQTH